MQPATEKFTSLATQIVKLVLGNTANVEVQRFYMGLGFSDVASRAKLDGGDLHRGAALPA